MEHALTPRRQRLGDPSRIDIAKQQRCLIEDKADRPNGRRTAEPGQDLLGNQRFQQEKQERAEKDSQPE